MKGVHVGGCTALSGVAIAFSGESSIRSVFRACARVRVQRVNDHDVKWRQCMKRMRHVNTNRRTKAARSTSGQDSCASSVAAYIVLGISTPHFLQVLSKNDPVPPGCSIFPRPQRVLILVAVAIVPTEHQPPELLFVEQMSQDIVHVVAVSPKHRHTHANTHR